MAKKEGWVKIYRSLMDNPFWTQKPFSVGQAWVDLILMANHEDKIGPKGDLIPVGSLATSTRILAKRWGWSQGKVMRFIDSLSDSQMIAVTASRNGSLICLVKYSDFQGQRFTKRSTDRFTNRFTDGIPTRSKEEKKKEVGSAERSSPSRKRSNQPVSMADTERAMAEIVERMKRREATG